MYDCPTCGSLLKFDIASQKLACERCDNQYDVHAFDGKECGAEESTEYDVTVFRCPQCGGELTGTNQEAAVFCSYCGASTLLESRIGKQKRPQHIIPFKITKDECKKRFVKKMKTTGFAPNAVMDEKVVESFRGIYMPYWKYSVSQHGRVTLTGEKTHRSGDYIIHEHYDISGNLDAKYDGFSKDASATFDDAISDAIAPFDAREADEFTPAYLSGFYADIADVKSTQYDKDAMELADRETKRQIVKSSQIPSGITVSDKTAPGTFHTKLEKTEGVMYPVWFFSYLHENRIAYAAVNGQTGKVMADVPISKTKFLVKSCIWMIPIFVILNLFLTLTPRWTLTIAGIMDLLVLVAHYMSGIAIAKQNGEESSKIQLIEWLGLGAFLIALLVWFVSPVSDLWYYSVAIAVIVVMIVSMFDMIQSFNLRSTRKLPQFNRTGGDDRA